jgi:GMP synthase-like glutamine amidotransferase
MKAQILCIQFRRAPNAIAYEQDCISRALIENATCQFISALDTTLSWNDPALLLAQISGVVLGGSGDFDFDGGRSDEDPDKQMSYALLERLRPIFEYIFEHDIPTLGICFGHQLVGAFAGAQVCSDVTQKKNRSHEVHVRTDAHDHFLFSGVPASFHAIYGHKDSLDRVPQDAVLLIDGGEQCKVSALQYKNNIFTTQFHPELVFNDILEKSKRFPGYLPEGVSPEELYKDDSDANLIIKNFGRFVKNQTSL